METVDVQIRPVLSGILATGHLWLLNLSLFLLKVLFISRTTYILSAQVLNISTITRIFHLTAVNQHHCYPICGPWASASVHGIWKLTTVQAVRADKMVQQVWQQLWYQMPYAGGKRNTYTLVLWPPSSHHGVLTHIHTTVGTQNFRFTPGLLLESSWGLSSPWGH